MLHSTGRQSLGSSYKLLVKAALRGTLDGKEATEIYNAAQTTIGAMQVKGKQALTSLLT